MTRKVTLKAVRKDIADMEDPKSEKEDESFEEKMHSSPTIPLQNFATAKATLECHEQLNQKYRKAIHEHQCALRLEKQRGMTQKTINDNS